MRILIDCSYTRLNPSNVGITRVVRGLASALQSLQDASFRIELVAWSPEGFRQLPENELDRRSLKIGPQQPSGVMRLIAFVGTPAIRRTIGWLLPLVTQRLIWRWVSLLSYGRAARRWPLVSFSRNDVLLICDAAWNYDIQSALQQSRQQGCRVVTMVHDLIPLNHPDLCPRLFTTVFRHWLHASLANSDAIIGNSKATCAEVADYCARNSLPLPRCSSFRLGSENLHEPGCGAKSPIRKLVPAGSEAACFLVVGSIEPRKNHSFILDAFEQVWAARPDVCLLIIGRIADGTQATIRRIRRHPLFGSRLLLETGCTDAELDLAYRESKALIFASRAEGFGLPLVEARQRGCQVLASNIPAFRELADEGVHIFELDRPDRLVAAIWEVLDSNRLPPSAMPTFCWRDSARQLLVEIEAMQAPSPVSHAT